MGVWRVGHWYTTARAHEPFRTRSQREARKFLATPVIPLGVGREFLRESRLSRSERYFSQYADFHSVKVRLSRKGARQASQQVLTI